MTINRLIGACYNFFPGASTVLVKWAHNGEEIYHGRWDEKFIKEFGELKVLDFSIDKLKKNGVIETMEILVVKEYVK